MVTLMIITEIMATMVTMATMVMVVLKILNQNGHHQKMTQKNPHQLKLQMTWLK